MGPLLTPGAGQSRQRMEAENAGEAAAPTWRKLAKVSLGLFEGSLSFYISEQWG